MKQLISTYAHPMDETDQREKGATTILVAVLVATLLGLAGLATDVSLARREQRVIQAAADAGVLAGVLKLMNGQSDSSAITEATQVALANRGNMTLESVQVGHWDNVTRTFSNIGSHNAMRIQSALQTPVRLGAVWNFFSLSPRVEAVASFGGANVAECVVPFGIESSVLQGKHYGDTMSISSPSPGNWGKLDVGGINASSGPVFYNAFQSGVCTSTISVGDTISPGTGFAQVSPAFKDRMAVNPRVVMPVVQGFGNGNADVLVVGFVVVEILAQGNNGSNWSGSVRFLDEPAGLGAGGGVGQPYAMNRVLSR